MSHYNTGRYRYTNCSICEMTLKPNQLSTKCWNKDECHYRYEIKMRWNRQSLKCFWHTDWVLNYQD